MRLALAGVLSLVLFGCGGPACDDAALKASFINTCESGVSSKGVAASAASAYCACYWDALAAGYSCAGITAGAQSATDKKMYCQSCAPQAGLTCTD